MLLAVLGLWAPLGVVSAAPEPARVIVHDDLASIGTSSARAYSRTLYLNRHGVTLIPGVNNSHLNRSSLVSRQVTVPPWDVNPTVWSQTVTCLRQMFAPFDIEITETDPGAVRHLEAVFGGSPADLGVAGAMAGLSPFSSSCKVIEDSIVFTFTDLFPPSAQLACEIMAQEIGHSFGLDHQLLPEDPMTYLPYSGKRSFRDQTVACGESTARPCGMTSQPCRESQNSYALLIDRMGLAAGGDPPAVSIMSPLDGATMTGGFTITAMISDDATVKYATASIDGVEIGVVSGEPWAFMAADLESGSHVVAVTASNGAQQRTATIEIWTPPGDDAWSIGCASSGESGWALGALGAGLCRRRRRR